MSHRKLTKRQLSPRLANGPLSQKGTDKLSRQSIILGILKTGGLYTIKDIISRISATHKDIDCSEKTIQRDLTFLVMKKTLQKQGERRWSKYSVSLA